MSNGPEPSGEKKPIEAAKAVERASYSNQAIEVRERLLARLAFYDISATKPATAVFRSDDKTVDILLATQIVSADTALPLNVRILRSEEFKGSSLDNVRVCQDNTLLPNGKAQHFVDIRITGPQNQPIEPIPIISTFNYLEVEGMLELTNWRNVSPIHFVRAPGEEGMAKLAPYGAPSCFKDSSYALERIEALAAEIEAMQPVYTQQDI